MVKKASYLLFMVGFILISLGSCVKSQYQTKAGKKKQKHYNSIQYPKTPGKVNNQRNTSR